jgi:hypothetical protein
MSPRSNLASEPKNVKDQLFRGTGGIYVFRQLLKNNLAVFEIRD